MQKITKIAGSLLVLGTLVLNTVAAVSAASSISINNPGFESSSSFTGWTAGSNWTADSSIKHGGSKAARVKGTTDSNSILKQSPLTTAGYNNIKVSFWYYADESLESTDFVKAEYTTDGTNWNTFYTINDSNDYSAGNDDDEDEDDHHHNSNNGWYQASSATLPSLANNNPNFGIRFVANLNSASSDRVNIDDVSVTGDQIQYKVLTVNTIGDGSASSNPTGISCGADCSESYVENTIVTLNPSANFGSEFTGWSGACSGTGTCSVTMSNAKSVTANFDTIKTTLSATKVVCNSEADLPNWGQGASDITSTTATDYVAAHPNCHLEKDWNFEWAPISATNPGDNLLAGGSPWTVFGPTNNSGLATTVINGGDQVWVREQMKSEYVTFSGATSDLDSEVSKNSAELYCQSDVLNYDNFDYTNASTVSNTVHCVAFNALEIPVIIDQCPNIEGDQATVPEGKHKDGEGDCVLDEVVPICSEKTMNVISGTDDTTSPGASTILSFLHSAWDQTSLGTNWIWNMDGVTDSLSDETATFTKNFTIPGTPISATLSILADNEYTGFVNSFTSIGATDGDNFLSPDSYTVPVENLINGTNQISFTVKNWALPNSTAQDNPAGLNYKLEVKYNECVNPEPPVNTPPTVILTGPSNITLTVGDAYTEQGAVGDDAEDLIDPTPVITGGPVVTGTPGTFTLTYTVTDTGGLTATTTRTVTVNPAIVIEDPKTACNDEIDNGDEEDSLIDMNDPGCASPEDNDETNTPEQPPVFACNDGIDNDGDNKIDFTGESTDPGCSSSEDNDETNPTVSNPENPGNPGGVVPTSFLVGAPAPQGRVLGASTTCGIYLEKYLRKGYKNDEESVKKVQKFLNDYFKLNIPVTGFFGPQTDSAVKKFQTKFSDEILKPWKLSGPTGIVYLTTTTKINKIMCPELDLQIPNLIPIDQNPEAPKL